MPKKALSPPKTSSNLFLKAHAGTNEQEYCLSVPVILYHHIQPLYLSHEKKQDGLTVGVEYFDMHMNYLASQGYHTLTADQLVSALLNKQTLPEKSIVVTFDDGYEDNYLYAYPILKRYNIVGNFMISTGLIGKKDYMSWEQLQEMARNPLIKFYNHTSHHIDVGNAKEDEIRVEISSAQKALEDHIGAISPIFTYPYGSVSQNARSVLQKLGYAAAFTTQPGFQQCRSTIYDLRRNHVGNLPLSSFGL